MRRNIILFTTIIVGIAIFIGIANLRAIKEIKQDVYSIQDQVNSTVNDPPSLVPGVPNTALSMDQALTNVVEMNSPAVVSIVISRNLPDIDIEYINPFENDPLLKDIGIRVPVIRNKDVTPKKIGVGSGFIVSNDGHIVTNRHVVSDDTAKYTVLLSDGSKKEGTVVFRDNNHDVAVIKIDGNFDTVVTLGDSSTVKPGQTVVAIGDALGEYNNTVSVGVISGLNRSIEASDLQGNVEVLNDVMQTDASINPGNSGGPLLDLDGRVIGINVATIYGSNNINFSIPINTVKSAISTYIK